MCRIWSKKTPWWRVVSGCCSAFEFMPMQVPNYLSLLRYFIGVECFVSSQSCTDFSQYFTDNSFRWRIRVEPLDHVTRNGLTAAKYRGLGTSQVISMGEEIRPRPHVSVFVWKRKSCTNGEAAQIMTTREPGSKTSPRESYFPLLPRSLSSLPGSHVILTAQAGYKTWKDHKRNPQNTVFLSTSFPGSLFFPPKAIQSSIKIQSLLAGRRETLGTRLCFYIFVTPELFSCVVKSEGLGSRIWQGVFFCHVVFLPRINMTVRGFQSV